MIINESTAEKIVRKITKIIDIGIEVFNHQGVVVGSTNEINIGSSSEHALKALVSNSRGFYDRGGVNNEVVEESLISPISFNDKMVGGVIIIGSSRDILQSEEIIKTIVGLVLDEKKVFIEKEEREGDDLILSIIDFDRKSLGASYKRRSDFCTESEWVVVVFEVCNKDDKKGLSNDQLQQVLFGLNKINHRDIIEAVSPRKIVMLKRVKVFNRGWDYQNTLKKVEDYCSLLDSFSWLSFFVGCGEYYDGIDRLSVSYQSALHSLAIGKCRLPKQKIYCYKNMALDVLLLSTSNDWTSEHLTKNYRVLEKNDKNGTLRETLRCLFNANLNLRVTAEDLNVHINTLRYRMEKIRDYTGMNLKDIDNIFFLYTAFKLNDMNSIRVQ